MAISKKGSRKIVVENQEFRWRLKRGGVIVWSDKNNCKVIGSVDFRNDKREVSKDHHVSEGYVVITNKIIKEVILHVGVKRIMESKGTINIGNLEDIKDFDKIERRYPSCWCGGCC